MDLVKGILDSTVNAGLYDLINKKDVLRASETAMSRMELSNADDGPIFRVTPGAQS